jgi:hypothetical protein
MDNVQDCDSYISVPSSQICNPYLYSVTYKVEYYGK